MRIVNFPCPCPSRAQTHLEHTGPWISVDGWVRHMHITSPIGLGWYNIFRTRAVVRIESWRPRSLLMKKRTSCGGLYFGFKRCQSFSFVSSWSVDLMIYLEEVVLDLVTCVVVWVLSWAGFLQVLDVVWTAGGCWCVKGSLRGWVFVFSIDPRIWGPEEELLELKSALSASFDHLLIRLCGF